jgi:hypothetical protein
MSEMHSFTACQIGSDKVGNQAKPLTFSGGGEEFSYQFKADVQHLATNLDTKPTMTQQRLTCVLKNSRLQPDGYCCLSDMGSKIIFTINCRHVNQGFNVGPWEEVHWCAVL